MNLCYWSHSVRRQSDLNVVSSSSSSSRFFSKTGDKDMNGPVLRESEMLVLGEMPC